MYLIFVYFTNGHLLGFSPHIIYNYCHLVLTFIATAVVEQFLIVRIFCTIIRTVTAVTRVHMYNNSFGLKTYLASLLVQVKQN